MTPNTRSIGGFPQPHLPGTPFGSGRQRPKTRNEPGTTGPSSDEEDQEVFRQLCDWFREGVDRSLKWRQETETAYDLVAGWQWDDADISILNESGRPSVTFNRIARNIDLITGQEVNSRDEVNYLPREQGDVARSEVLSAGVSFIADETDALDEKSDAFRDLCVCGMGWTQTLMDYRDHPKGLPVETRRDPLEMYWDPHSSRRNLKDSRWRARAVTIPMREAKKKFPHADPAMLSADWANITEGPSDSSPDRQSQSYEDASYDGRPPLLDRVTVIEIEWWETENFVIMEDLFSGERNEMPKGRADAVMSNFKGRFRGLPVERRVFHKAFLGGVLLGRRKMEEVKDFTFQPMTAKRDRRVGWYGLVRAMSDPQRWANKWLSQSMHIMNSNGKGGVMYEEGAFADPQKAERNWGKAGSFTKLNTGALSGGMVQERAAGAFPAELDKLMPLALQSIQDCAGIPVESLGESSDGGSNRSALFEYARREAGLVVMATMFDAKRLFMKRQGRLLLSYMLHFMNDGRLVRIVEKGQEKYVPLVFENPDETKFDIVVDSAPNSPNEREKTWAIIERFLPFVQGIGASPKFYADLLPYIPHFPSTLTRSLQKTLIEQQEKEEEEGGKDGEKNAGQTANAEAKMAELQLKSQKLPAEMEKLQAETQRLMAQAKELESQIVLNFATAEEKRASTEMGGLEQIRETIALDDARKMQRFSAHEAA